ncbi:hypothetical protein ACFYT4_25095 [Streptomyces sp. NPDC004609]|uniref:hypothetical protein n=1 Tax=Streptomyces sp. NPDC004609 TaxID=3364704 RepID=UPI003694734D
MSQSGVAPLTPVPPHAAINTFTCLRAVEADDPEAAAEFAGAEAQIPALLSAHHSRVVPTVIDVAHRPPRGARRVHRSTV